MTCFVYAEYSIEFCIFSCSNQAYRPVDEGDVRASEEGDRNVAHDPEGSERQ